MDAAQNKEILELEPQDTGLIKQQGWELTQIFCIEDGYEEETKQKALDFAEKLSVQFKVALHMIEDYDFRILEIYRK